MKRFFHIVGLSVIALWLWHGGSAFAVETRIALVIGNGSYAEAPLANPVNDARLMAETLRGLGFEVIESIDADRKTIQNAVFELQDLLFAAGKDAVGLFFYAGHGIQVGGQNYLIPLNSNIKKEREVAVEAVSANFILGQMEVADNRMNFIILDACRNNPLTRSFRSATRGLARMNAPKGSLVAYATGPGEVAADGTGANSPYTLALVEALQVRGIPAEKMFKRVREMVMAATKGEQTPWEESSLTGTDFYFVIEESDTVETTKAPPTTAPSGFDERQMELTFWQSIKDSSDPLMFEAYLRNYPNGTFADIARLKSDALATPKTETKTEPIDSDLAFWESIKDSDDPADFTGELDIQNNTELKNAITKYYEEQSIFEGPQWGHSNTGQASIESILELRVLSSSNNTVILAVRYKWYVRDAAQEGRNEKVVTVDISENSFRVIDMR